MMNIVDDLLLKLFIPQLHSQTFIKDKRSRVQARIVGIPLQRVKDACKTPEAFNNVLTTLQKYLLAANLTLQVYEHEMEYYLTAVATMKHESYLDDEQALILGYFIILRQDQQGPIIWNEMEKELKSLPLKINKPRDHLEFLVTQGLLYKVSNRPLILDFGPTFFLEFDDEGIDKLTLKLRFIFLKES